MVEDRNGRGRFTPEHTDEELLDAVRTHEPAATSEVSDEVGVTRQAADYRLRKLQDAGRVESKKIGASLVWFAPARESTRERRETTPPDPETSRRREQPDPDTHAESGSQTPESEDPVERVAREEWGDSDPRIEQRKAAARAVLEYITEHGTVSKQEAKTEVYPEHAVDGQNARTWYRSTVRPVLNEAAEYNQSAREYQLREDVTLPEGASEV